MIRNIGITLLIFFSLDALCQNDSVANKMQYGIFTGTYLVEDYQTSVCATFTKNRHTFYTGLAYLWDVPVINDRNIKEYEASANPMNPNAKASYAGLTYNSKVLSNMALWVGYQYKLTKLDRRVKFFLEGNASTYGLKFSKDTVLQLGRIENYVKINVGASVKIRFLKNFYYYANLGAGPVLVFRNNIEKKTKSFGYYLDTGGTVLGLGYNF